MNPSTLQPLLCLLALVAPRVAIAQAAADALVGASSDEHVWMAFDSDAERPGVDLLHHAGATEGPYVSAVLRLAAMPEALAAWGDSVWIVFPPRGEESPIRAVYRARIGRNELFGTWFVNPPGRMDVEASLPGEGRLVALAGTDGGPAALLAAESGDLRLLALDRQEWTELDLPPEIDPATRLMWAGGADGRQVRLLAPDGEDGAVLHTRQEQGLWRRSRLELDPDRVLRTTASGGRAMVAVRDGDGVELGFMRTSLVARLGRFDRPDGRWSVFGLSDRIVQIELRGSELAIRRIDPVTGDLGPAETMVPQPARTGSFVAIAFMWLLAMGAMLMIFFFRPAAEEVALPPELEVAPPVIRLVALLIDLAPSVALAMLLLSCSLTDLVHAPIVTPDVARTAPYLLACSITVAHETLGELLAGRSLGKALVGIRVADVEGRRATSRQVLVRNLVKSLVLFLPPLAVFTILNPYQQGLPEQMARMVVVRRVTGNPVT